jgi:hypothetical protein
MQPGAELLIDPPFISRASAWLAALAKANPGAKVTRGYRGRHRLLVLYGVGHPVRARTAKIHLRAGGRVAMWDLGYWNRNESMRLSIDRNHPTAEQLAANDHRTPRHRPKLAGEKSFDPDGPILLCGLGPKSCKHLGLTVAAFALYKDDPNPGEDARREFLARLAWWNWGNHEAVQAWRFMEDMTK